MSRTDVPELSLFSFNGHDVRCYLDENSETCFILKDLADVFGQETQNIRRRLDEGAFRLVKVSDANGHTQSMTAVTEAGMYDVVIHSDKGIAKPFKRWVTHEVLPSIRKTGAYQTRPMTALESLQQTINAMVERERRLALLEAASAEEVRHAKVNERIVAIEVKHRHKLTHRVDEIEERVADLEEPEGHVFVARWLYKHEIYSNWRPDARPSRANISVHDKERDNAMAKAFTRWVNECDILEREGEARHYGETGGSAKVAMYLPSFLKKVYPEFLTWQSSQQRGVHQ